MDSGVAIWEGDESSKTYSDYRATTHVPRFLYYAFVSRRQRACPCRLHTTSGRNLMAFQGGISGLREQSDHKGSSTRDAWVAKHIVMRQATMRVF